MSKSTIIVGLPLPKESTAMLLISTLEKRNKLQGVLGTYSYEKNAEGKFVVSRTLTADEKIQMEEMCANSMHMIHSDGYCVRCHAHNVTNN